jgi:integrase
MNPIKISKRIKKPRLKPLELASQIPSSEEFKEMILNMRRKRFETRREYQWQLLACLMYLTGARVSEVLDLNKSSFTLDERNDPEGKYVIVSIKTLKQEEIRYRNVLINRNHDSWALELIQSFFDKYPGDKLFSMYGDDSRLISRNFAWKEIKDRTGYRNHFFRHGRATNCERELGMDSGDLMVMFGWKTPYMTSIYVHRDWLRLIGKV